MKMTKILLGSAALVALSLGYASDAKAFDTVDWEWTKLVKSTETIEIEVIDTFDISGLVEIEKTQVNIGDVTATSTVTGITNNPPGAASDGTFSGTVSLDIDYETEGTGTYNPANTSSVSYGGDITDVTLDASLAVNAEVSPTAESDNISLTVSGQIDLTEVGVNDAVDLPSVESVATAVANNQSIESTVAVNLHDGQYNMGDIGVDYYDDTGNLTVPPTALSALMGTSLDVSDNTATDILAIATLGAALGIIQQGEVTALSDVKNITNASVDSSATAVGNNLSVDLDANTEGDAFMIADITQFNYANVSASSLVSDVSVNNYADLNVLEGPLVSSVATAVGNNVSISVTSP